MKLGVLARSYQYLQPLTDIKLPFNFLLKLEEFIKEAGDKVTFYNEKYDKLLVVYGEEIEPNKYKIKPQNLDKYVQEYNELSDVEVDLIPPEIPLAKLESMELSMKTLSALRDLGMIKIPEESEK